MYIMEKKAYVHVTDLHTRDCCIVPDPKEKKYFLFDCFPTPGQTGSAINVRESEDLQWWSPAYPVFVPDADYWGPLDFWAPECHYWRGKYYAISSFRAPGGYRGCQFLVADTPRGPFVPMVNKPATPANWHCLDGTLYEDKEGNPWMVFCHEWLQVHDGQICAIRMKEDLSDSIGAPIILFRASEAPWKYSHTFYPEWKYNAQPKSGWERVTDGPYLRRGEDGTLFMVWTSFADTGYATGYARSVSGEIYGPWEQEPEPLYTLHGGHAMLFNRFDGTLMMTLHCPNIPQKERMLLFEMEMKGNKLHIINEITGNWRKNFYLPDGRQKRLYEEDNFLENVQDNSGEDTEV